MKIEERDTGMEKAWFDWETFKNHAYEGHFNDMDHLEDEEERKDEKFWDDLGDELEYEDPEDLDDHQKQK